MPMVADSVPFDCLTMRVIARLPCSHTDGTDCRTIVRCRSAAIRRHCRRNVGDSRIIDSSTCRYIGDVTRLGGSVTTSDTEDAAMYSCTASDAIRDCATAGSAARPNIHKTKMHKKHASSGRA